MVRSKSQDQEEGRPLHVVVLGAKEAGCAAAAWASRHGARVTMIHDGRPLAESCVELGSAPVRFLAHIAQLVHQSRAPSFEGLHWEVRLEDYARLVGQFRERMARVARQQWDQLRGDLKAVRHLQGPVEVTGPTSVRTPTETIVADRLIVATSSVANVPAIGGMADVPILEEAEILAFETLPASLIIYGSQGYSLCYAQSLARLGVRVTLLEPHQRLLPAESRDIGELMHERLAQEGVDIHTGVELLGASTQGQGIELAATARGQAHRWRAEHLAFISCRRANLDGFGLGSLGLALTEEGYVRVDESMRTSLEHVYAAGQVTGRPPYASVAAYDGMIAAHNAVMPSKTVGSYTAVPFVLFTDPQISGVGWDEDQARAHGFQPQVEVLPMDEIPVGQMLGDTIGWIKLIREARSDQLLGVRLVSSRAGDQLMEAALAVRYGLAASELASILHPTMTYSEGYRLAALRFFGNDRMHSVFTR